MDTKSLEVFIDLAEDLHFSRTSDHNMSPSTLSRLIQRLERDSKCPLFERSNRSVSLTSAGKRYLDFARQTLSAWQDLQQVNQMQQDQPSGAVSLYCSVTASHSVLTAILSDLRDRQPLIEIKLHTGDQALSLSRLQQGKEDFVIAARPDRLDQHIDFKVLSRSELVFIAPKARVRCGSNKLCKSSNWSDVPWVMASRVRQVVLISGFERKVLILVFMPKSAVMRLLLAWWLWAAVWHWYQGLYSQAVQYLIV